MINELCKNPFKLFFPVAFYCALLGSGLWLAYGVFNIGEFPLENHAHLFMGGFIYFSIFGFLLTAIPRFTQTDFLSRAELFLFFILVVFVCSFYIVGHYFLFWMSLFSGWPLLLTFAAKRFRARKQNPPYTFAFVGFGLLLGLMGSFLNALYYWDESSFAAAFDWGRLLFYDAMVSAFILGVGGRLIPGILGFTEIVASQREVYEKPEPFLKVIPIDVISCLFIFGASLILEGVGYIVAAFITRALVITYFGFRFWRLHEQVKTKRWHGRMLKLSCWFILFGSWLLCFYPDYTIHIRHLIYIGCYFLMTIMVSSRVIVSHAGQSLEIEQRKFPYLVVGILIAFAALTRSSAILMPDSYIRHLGYTGLVLFISLVLWLIWYVILSRKMRHDETP